MIADVEAVNLKRREAVLSTGEVIPISNLIDADGYDTGDPEEALVAVAGPTSRGGWYSIDLREFCGTLH